MRKIIIIFTTIILILSFSSCFASESISFNDFQNLLKEEGLTLSDSQSSNSKLIEYLGKNPLIFYNYDKSKIYLYYQYNNTANQYKLYYYSDKKAIYINVNETGGSCFRLVGNISQNEVVFETSDERNNNTDYLYSYVNNSMTLSDFQSFNNIKKYFMDKIIFNGTNGVFYNGVDIFYKFDGVFKGNGTQSPYTSSFTVNNEMFRFEYTAYTDLTDSNVANYFYFQEFTPSEAVNLTDEDLKFTDSDLEIVVNQKLESNFSYTSLIRRMQEGYIYRLYCFSNQHNSSGDLIRTTDATSCFFSLNSWKSNQITVLNIYELMFPENPDIEQEGGTSGGVIDLENIENSINNSNKNYWGDPDNLNPEDFEDELENNFNGIMENLSGELTQNQIFESLQGAEDGFLNFFKQEQNEQFYDLSFSWPDVEFMGEILIPAGGINISEMCREIPELETLRSYIRVIFNFTVAVALIKQIYNLILSTLGIDNPYLYEDYDEVTSINEDTGEYRQTAVKRKKIYNRRR